MLHEGLAAYTGAALSGAPIRVALAALEDGVTKPGFSRSFAYASGPAWGILLDDMRHGWRKGLRTETDLPDLIGLPPAAEARPRGYNGVTIHREESAIAATRQANLDRLLIATDPTRSLHLPLAKMGMDFDPNRVTAAPDGSSIYEKMTLSDVWGSVDVDGHALRISGDFTEAFVQWPLPSPDSLQLSAGWTVVTDETGKPTLRGPRD